MSLQKPTTCAIIPARYGSSRLPGKPLVDFHGKPMIEHVYNSVSNVYTDVAVATDHEEIVKAVEKFGGQAIMTSIDHDNGTSRVKEAFASLGWTHDYVVNVQGDEPMISPSCLHELNGALEDEQTEIATLIAHVKDEQELFGDSEVFVALTENKFALYFSRSIIPFYQDIPHDQWLEHGTFYKHVGLYAYKPEILNKIVQLKPSWIETSERLEQNRWLANGYKIKTAVTETQSFPVDTPEDVDFVRLAMERQK